MATRLPPIYCSDTQDRIPPEYFAQGKAVWCSGKPYLTFAARQLGLKYDSVPPAKFAALQYNPPKASETAPSSYEIPRSPVPQNRAKTQRPTQGLDRRPTVKSQTASAQAAAQLSQASVETRTKTPAAPATPPAPQERITGEAVVSAGVHAEEPAPVPEASAPSAVAPATSPEVIIVSATRAVFPRAPSLSESALALQLRDTVPSGKRGEQIAAELRADSEARALAEKADAEARPQAAAAARAKAWEEAQLRWREAAEARARAKAEAMAMAEAEAKARAEVQEKARQRAEAEAKARAEAQAKAREEAEAREKAAAEARARAQAAAKAKAEAEAIATARAEERAHFEAEARARAEAQSRALAEAETKAREEEEAKERAEAEVRAREEAEAQFKAELEAIERTEAEARARLDAAASARADVQTRARKRAEEGPKAEAEARAQAGAAAKARAEAAERAKSEAEARAKAEAEAKAREEAEARARAEAEAKAREEADEQKRAEAEARAKEEAEAQARAENEASERAEAQARAQAEAEARKHEDAEAQAREEVAALERAEAEAQARAEAERKAREEAEAQARAEAERKAREEAEARAREEAEREALEEAERKAREEAEAKARAEAERKAREEAEAKEREAIEAKARAESAPKAAPAAIPDDAVASTLLASEHRKQVLDALGASAQPSTRAEELAPTAVRPAARQQAAAEGRLQGFPQQTLEETIRSLPVEPEEETGTSSSHTTVFEVPPFLQQTAEPQKVGSLPPTQWSHLAGFEGLSEEQTLKLFDASARRVYKAGETVCCAGDKGFTAFYLLSGKAEVSLPAGLKPGAGQGQSRRLAYIPIDGPVDLEWDRPVAELRAGELFGEMTCLANLPRSATVCALEDCEVLELLPQALLLLRENRLFRERIERTYRERALKQHLRNIPLLQGAEEELLAALSARAEMCEVGPGTELLKPGIGFDVTYILRCGLVKASRREGEAERAITHLRRGESFGALAPLQSGGPGARYKAMTLVSAAKLTWQDIDELMNSPGRRRKSQETPEEQTCENCADPRCLPECPIGGIARTPDGDLTFDESCIGCGTCAESCPYGQITLEAVPGAGPKDPKKARRKAKPKPAPQDRA